MNEIIDKEKLTQATLAELQKQLETDMDIYMTDDRLSQFMDIFVAASTEEELFNVLRQMVNDYDNKKKLK